MNDSERIGAATPEWIAARLGPGLSAGLADRLIGLPRFATRLRAAAMERLGDLPALDPRQAAALELDGTGLRGLTLRAGAVWHAAALARVVDGAARRRIVEAIGSEAYDAALRGRALAPAGAAHDLPKEGDIAEVLRVDGEGCWEAWRRLQPPPVALRLELLACGSSQQEAHGTFGPPIVAWLLERS